MQKYTVIIKNMQHISGNCNNDKSDDMLNAFGIVSSNPDEFGASWHVEDVPKGKHNHVLLKFITSK